MTGEECRSFRKLWSDHAPLAALVRQQGGGREGGGVGGKGGWGKVRPAAAAAANLSVAAV